VAELKNMSYLRSRHVDESEGVDGVAMRLRLTELGGVGAEAL